MLPAGHMKMRRVSLAMKAKFKLHGRSSLRLGRCRFRNLEIDPQKTCAPTRNIALPTSGRRSALGGFAIR
jgi:hypothetical protein